MHQVPHPAAPLLLLALFPACSAPVQSSWFTDHGSTSASTGTRKETLEVTAAMGAIAVDLEVSCTEGSATWKLLDPDGICRWTTASGPTARLEQHLAVQPIAGTWSIERVWNGFTGTQSFTVAARTPIGLLTALLGKR